MTKKEVKRLLREVCADLEKEESDNTEKAQRAWQVLQVYAALTGQDEESESTLLGDLLADCFHHLGADAVNRCVLMGSMHYEEEARVS